ncbi:MAG: hypothetical protein IPF62_10010 [Bacteroidetes bacterium]|nr:hypothetical protein [Bacteroidota bacterium]HQW46004.1 hypothetical protein [Chitinophagaceae bacterium]MBK6818630.1 hypothetical protein [Bacteroidota bacterium]MBK7040154.1 hypothetical protein [Bacteroidota bacterium]MBK7586983.1 hypothetical protein [Bacteroidota bacterium]
MNKTNLITCLLMLITSMSFAQGYRVNRTNERTKAKVKSAGLGKNIIAFSPAQFSVNNVMGDGNGYVSVGFSYERIFDNELISLKLPVNFTIEHTGVILMPTIKLYPKKQGVVKYAVGPQFLIAMIDEPYYNYFSSYSSSINYTRKQFGFALNNSLNFTISKHLYLGIDASLGILYYDSFNDMNKNYNGGNNYYNDSPMNLNQTFNLGFNMGFRF